MKVEIIFRTSSTPKVVELDAVFVNDSVLRTQYPSGKIVNYPLCNIFSWAYEHRHHIGSTRKDSK